MEEKIRRCYEQAGLAWPARVVWAPSPVAGWLLAARLVRRHTPATVRVRAVARYVRQVVPVVVVGVLTFLPGAAVCCVGVAVTLLGSLPGDSIIAPSNEVSSFPPEHLWGMWVGGLVGGLAAIYVFVRVLVADGSRGIGENLVVGVLMTVFATVPALIGEFPGLGVSWLLGGFAPPSSGWINLLLGVGLGAALVGAAVTGTVIRWRAGPPRLYYPDPAHERLSTGDGDLADPDGWFWPHTAFVVISEEPTTLRVERVGGTRRLHSTDGPAAEWADGTRVYAVHGTVVPATLVEGGWSVAAVHEHPNTEVRRAAIELIGWATYIRRAGWRQVATADDPGNPPHTLALYEDPRGRLPGVRVLVMTNGSPDRSGAVRTHAETVPDTIDDPVAAAAWQYGCPVETYRRLGRRT